jgi:hypothetical protein
MRMVFVQNPSKIGKGFNANVNHANHRFNLSSITKSMIRVTVQSKNVSVILGYT